MASNLYKALENIEKGRQACITGARNHGHDIKDNATLQQLAETVFDIGDHINNQIVQIPELEEGYTFDTDPTRWRRPSDWPNLKEIFMSFDDEEVEGMMLFPHSAFLLDNSKTTITFYTNGSSCPNPQNYDITLGPSRIYLNRTYYKTPYRIYTSDGQCLDMFNDSTGSFNMTHTWDASKDIDGKYRWIVVYAPRREETSISPYYSTQAIEQLEVFRGTSQSNYWFGPALINYELIPTWTNRQNELLQTTLTSVYGGSNANRSKLQSVTLETDDLTYINQFRYFCAKWTHFKKYGLTTIKLSNYDSGHVIGVKADYPMQISELYYNDMDYGNVKYYCLRYLEGFDISGVNQSTLSVCNLCNMPIKDFSWLTTIGGADCFRHYFKNTKYIDLGNVTNIVYESAVRDMKADVIDLHSLQALNGYDMFGGCSCRKILLDSVQSINNSFWWPEGVAEINLPNCTVVNGIISSPNSMLVLRLPKLESCTQPDRIFENCRCLKWIELPNNFTQNFDFKNCFALTSKCKEEIINKAADMTGVEGEHVLTFDSNYVIPEEWQSIANAKNWVIK